MAIGILDYFIAKKILAVDEPYNIDLYGKLPSTTKKDRVPQSINDLQQLPEEIKVYAESILQNLQKRKQIAEEIKKEYDEYKSAIASLKDNDAQLATEVSNEAQVIGPAIEELDKESDEVISYFNKYLIVLSKKTIITSETTMDKDAQIEILKQMLQQSDPEKYAKFEEALNKSKVITTVIKKSISISPLTKKQLETKSIMNVVAQINNGIVSEINSLQHDVIESLTNTLELQTIINDEILALENFSGEEK